MHTSDTSLGSTCRDFPNHRPFDCHDDKFAILDVVLCYTYYVCWDPKVSMRCKQVCPAHRVERILTPSVATDTSGRAPWLRSIDCSTATVADGIAPIVEKTFLNPCWFSDNPPDCFIAFLILLLRSASISLSIVSNRLSGRYADGDFGSSFPLLIRMSLALFQRLIKTPSLRHRL